MHVLDLVILVWVGLVAIMGLRLGVMRQIISLATWTAVFLGILFLGSMLLDLIFGIDFLGNALASLTATEHIEERVAESLLTGDFLEYITIPIEAMAFIILLVAFVLAKLALAPVNLVLDAIFNLKGALLSGGSRIVGLVLGVLKAFFYVIMVYFFIMFMQPFNIDFFTDAFENSFIIGQIHNLLGDFLRTPITDNVFLEGFGRIVNEILGDINLEMPS
ncbi:MAG: CvpA family protein [Firmicutes bacterium]|nr:CvpA family protein [Bacillota bacterium]